MTFTEVRNAVIDGLTKHIGRPVVLSDQIADIPDLPYGYYSVLTPRASGHYFGLMDVIETPEGAIVKRSEPVKATMSFTFCSRNRDAEDGYIYGDDEAQELAEKAHGFFLLNGHNISTDSGDVVVNNVGPVADRSGFVVEDTVRRYGFDVRLSYVRTDEMPVGTIEKVSIERNPYSQEGGTTVWQKKT